jgi:plastocyanin
MKRIILSKIRTVLSIGIMLAIINLSNSCTKSSTNAPGGGSDQPSANEVWMQGMVFNPATITVPTGTTVKWTNKASFTHNVTSATAVFSSGAMGNGSTFSFQFITAGTYPYTCTLHPGMAGTVIVQ